MAGDVNVFIDGYDAEDPDESNAEIGGFTIWSDIGSGSGAVTVGWEVDFGSSTASSDDVSTSSGSVTLDNGSDSAWVSISAVDDADPEPAESLTINLLPGTGYSISNGTLGLSVYDNDGGSGSGSGRGNQPPDAVDDSVTTQMGTAVNVDVLGNDSDPDGDTLTVTSHGTPSHGSVTNNNGILAYTPQTDFTGTDSFTYTIEDPDGASDSATVTIDVTDATFTVKIESLNDVAEDDDGFGEFLITRSGQADSGNALTVYFDVDGSATEGVDFGSLGGSIDIPAYSPSVVLRVDPSDDYHVEGSEDVLVTLVPDIGPENGSYEIGSPSSATIEIYDDDLVLTVSAYDDTAKEEPVPQQTGVFRISLPDNEALSDDLTVSYVVSGSADPGDDYVALPGEATITAADSYVDVYVVAVNDPLKEEQEDVVPTLNAPSDNSYRVGSPASAAVNIEDNDDWHVYINASTPAIKEGEVGRFIVTRSGETDLTHPLVVKYTVAGDATPIEDYEPLSGSVTIESNRVTAEIDVVAKLDTDVDEGDESVHVTLTADPGYTIGAPDNDTLVIEHAAPWKISVEKVDDGAERADDSQPGKFKVKRESANGEPLPMDDPLTVRFQILPASTASLWIPDDYSLVAPGGAVPLFEGLVGTVVIPANESDVEIIVEPFNDKEREPDETVKIQLEPDVPAGMDYEVAQANAELTIEDNDDWVVRIASDPVFNVTGEVWPFPGKMTVTRDNGSDNDTSHPLTVHYTTPIVFPNLDAQNGVDYVALSGEVVIPAGSLIADIYIVPINDNRREMATELAVVDLSPNEVFAEGGYRLDANPANTFAVIDIWDNDRWLVELATVDPIASEDGLDPGHFVITRSGETDLTHGLPVYYTIGGTAVNGLLTGSTSIPAGQFSRLLFVDPVNDNLLEAVEFVDVQLLEQATLNVPGGYELGASIDGTVAIEDNDDWHVHIEATTPTTEEGSADPGQFTVTRTGETDTTHPLVVENTVAGDATPTTDYEALGGSVTIASGETAATIDVNAEFDTDEENDETVVVTLEPHPEGAAGHYTLDSPHEATVTIEDRPPWKVSVEKIVDAAERADDSQPGKFKVKRESVSGDPLPLDDPLTVRFQILPDSTSRMVDPDADYTLTVPGGSAPADEGAISTVTISAGQSEVEIVVNAINDNVREGDETVNIQLEPDTAPMERYELDEPKADLIIKDNDDWVVTIESTTPTTEEGSAVPGQFTVTRTGEIDGEFKIELTNGALNEDLAVAYVLSGQAAQGVDYQPLPPRCHYCGQRICLAPRPGNQRRRNRRRRGCRCNPCR